MAVNLLQVLAQTIQCADPILRIEFSTLDSSCKTQTKTQCDIGTSSLHWIEGSNYALALRLDCFTPALTSLHSDGEIEAKLAKHSAGTLRR